MLISEVVTGRKRTPLIGTYLPPSTLEHLPDLEEAMTRFWDQYPIVLGYLNSNTGQSQNPLSQQVSDLLMQFELMDLLHHFWQCWRFRHIKTWSQARQGRLMQVICDYILGAYWCSFEMLGVRGINNYPSYHSVLQARLLIYPTLAGHD